MFETRKINNRELSMCCMLYIQRVTTRSWGAFSNISGNNEVGEIAMYCSPSALPLSSIFAHYHLHLQLQQLLSPPSTRQIPNIAQTMPLCARYCTLNNRAVHIPHSTYSVLPSPPHPPSPPSPSSSRQESSSGLILRSVFENKDIY